MVATRGFIKIAWVTLHLIIQAITKLLCLLHATFFKDEEIDTVKDIVCKQGGRIYELRDVYTLI